MAAPKQKWKIFYPPSYLQFPKQFGEKETRIFEGEAPVFPRVQDNWSQKICGPMVFLIQKKPWALLRFWIVQNWLSFSKWAYITPPFSINLFIQKKNKTFFGNGHLLSENKCTDHTRVWNNWLSLFLNGWHSLVLYLYNTALFL